MARNPPPGAPTLGKQRWGAPTVPPMFVYCEGETERVFVDELRAHYRISNRELSVFGSCGVPKSVVRRAEAKVRELRKSGGEVWAVFDRDEHESWDAAIKDATRAGVCLAVSNPCFELWAILLHAEHSAHIERHEAQHRLRALHAGYHHERNPYLELSLVLPGLDEARRRCESLLRRARDDGDDWRNPSSHMHTLVDAIRRRVVGE